MTMNALDKATAYLNRKPHTEKEVIDYLVRKGFGQEDASAAVNSLKEYGYIDDLAYSKMYYVYGFEKGRGTDRIKRELVGKGVDRAVIEQAYDELEDKPDEYEVAAEIAYQIVEETGKKPSEMTYEEKQKLQAKIVRRLASRGFSGSICYSAARVSVK